MSGPEENGVSKAEDLMTREAYAASWRTYAAAAVQGMIGNPGSGSHDYICSKAAEVAGRMVEKEVEQLRKLTAGTRHPG